MKQLPSSKHAILIRTDFSNESDWDRLRQVIETPTTEDFMADVTYVNDVSFAGASPTKLTILVPASYVQPMILIADRLTLSSHDLPILVVGVGEDQGRTFRIVASELWSLENNVFLSNMDLEEFYDAIDEDGIFRGF